MANIQRIFRIVNRPVRVIRIMGKAGAQGSATGLTPVVATDDLTLTANTAVSIQEVDGDLLIATLPATCPLGSFFLVQGQSSGGWQINLNTGQTFTNWQYSVTGAGHGIKSTFANDGVYFWCTSANTQFVLITANGQPTTF